MRELIIEILKYLPDRLFYIILFVIKHNYIPNFNKPKSFNEKINYIKINRTNEKLRSLIVDRLKVREYVKKESSNCELINILWHGYDLTKNTWEQLPYKFVIKANHGSGMVKVIDKNIDNFESIRNLCNNWQKKITQQEEESGFMKN